MDNNKHIVPNQMLRNAETLLELIPTGIVFLNAAGIITYANRCAEELLGLTRDKLSGLAYSLPHMYS